MLPVEYYEFTRELQWSIPYLHLPWETERLQPVMYSPNTSTSSYISELGFSALATKASVVYGSPLTSNEYESFFERQNSVPEAEYISDPQSSNGWKEFKRSMFWLAVMGGGLMIVRGVLVLVLKFKKNAAKEKKYGALIFPRFEIFLLILAVPCICLASASVIKGRTTLGMVTGVLLLGFTSSVELLLFLFLSFGITLGNLLQYKEIHQEGWKYHWYQELIRVTLGPGKRGQWSWKNIPNSKYLTIFGPLFEDLRGPPKYMLSQIAGGNPLTRSDRIIASDDENEDSEAPFIQKLFGILRIYYTLLESIRRFLLGVLAGAFLSKSTHKGPVIALLCLTFFQLFFLVLKKPFIKKRVQLVEIISIACETSVFATCLVLLEKGFSTQDESRIGIFMLILFILGYVSLLTNECYALYLQIRNMDTEKNSFLMGLKATSIGLLLFFVPQKLIKTPEKWVSSNSNGDTGSGDVSGSANRSRSSSRSDRPWMRQLREMARAGFKEGGAGENDPSTSYSRRSGFWGGKRSGSSSMTSFMDNKSRPRALNKDLETIFASK